jgi:hypothetical protein
MTKKNISQSMLSMNMICHNNIKIVDFIFTPKSNNIFLTPITLPDFGRYVTYLYLNQESRLGPTHYNSPLPSRIFRPSYGPALGWANNDLRLF